MLSIDRRKRLKHIFSLLHSLEILTVKEIAAECRVSEATARRDLSEMVQQEEYNNVERCYGGIRLVRTRSGSVVDRHSVSASITKHYIDIALAIPELIGEEGRIYIDQGPLCFRIAQEMANRTWLHLFTCDLHIAEEMAKYENIESFVIGGHVHKSENYTGDNLYSARHLDQLSIRKAIITADAIDIEHGEIYADTASSILFKRKLISKVNVTILAVHQTAIGKIAAHKVADLNSVDILVTNDELDEESAAKIRKAGVRLICAG
jgi:DeoR family transcriptional regulator of aga operon